MQHRPRSAGILNAPGQVMSDERAAPVHPLGWAAVGRGAGSRFWLGAALAAVGGQRANLAGYGLSALVAIGFVAAFPRVGTRSASAAAAPRAQAGPQEDRRDPRARRPWRRHRERLANRRTAGRTSGLSAAHGGHHPGRDRPARGGRPGRVPVPPPQTPPAATSGGKAAVAGAAQPGRSALQELGTCIETSGRAAAAPLLIDESGSLRETDPGNERVTAAKAALASLENLGWLATLDEGALDAYRRIARLGLDATAHGSDYTELRPELVAWASDGKVVSQAPEAPPPAADGDPATRVARLKALARFFEKYREHYERLEQLPLTAESTLRVGRAWELRRDVVRALRQLQDACKWAIDAQGDPQVG